MSDPGPIPATGFLAALRNVINPTGGWPEDTGPTEDDFTRWNEHNDHADDYPPED